MQSIGRCFLPQRLVNEMLSEADARVPFETGGVLLGVGDGVNVWIDAVIGPGPTSIHAKTSFIPDAEHQQQHIARIYEASGRRVSYLGDWHTHPGVAPYLSWRDRRTLRAISRTAGARQSNPLMIVIGYGTPWRIVACRYDAGPWYRRDRFSTLQVVVD